MELAELPLPTESVGILYISQRSLKHNVTHDDYYKYFLPMDTRNE